MSEGKFFKKGHVKLLKRYSIVFEKYDLTYSSLMRTPHRTRIELGRFHAHYGLYAFTIILWYHDSG